MTRKKKQLKDIEKVTREPHKERDLMLIGGLPIYEIGGFIDKKTARSYSRNYLKKQPFLNPKKKPVKGHLFGKGNVSKLIDQPDCHGIRVYYGLKKDEEGCFVPQLMMVGVYKDGSDMTDHTLILDMTLPCPEYCPDGTIF
jgi:hypothetical protein